MELQPALNQGPGLHLHLRVFFPILFMFEPQALQFHQYEWSQFFCFS